MIWRLVLGYPILNDGTMFGTLRLNSENNTTEFIEHAKGEEASYLGGYVFCHSACYNCRSKKVRRRGGLYGANSNVPWLGIVTMQWTEVGV